MGFISIEILVLIQLGLAQQQRATVATTNLFWPNVIVLRDVVSDLDTIKIHKSSLETG